MSKSGFLDGGLVASEEAYQECCVNHLRARTVDLILEVLREHERIFDSLLNHLDTSIDRMDIKRIEVMLEKESQESEKIEILRDKFAELENQIEKYKARIEEIESIPVSFKNMSK